jgi:Ca2+-binding RTX toxin-like protein
VDASGATLTVVDNQPGLNGDEGTDTLTGIETLRFNGVDYDVASFVSAGTAGADTVVGASGDDTLDGSAGADVVFGGRGNDTLDGGSEADAVFGGSGDDTIAGGSGGDVLSGGTGNDTLSYATDTVPV